MCFKVFRRYRSRNSSPSRHPPNSSPPLVKTSHSADKTHQFQSNTSPSSGPPAEAYRVDPSTSVQDDVPNARSSSRGLEQRSGWKTAANTGKMLLGVAKESADVFVPLKSVLGGLTELMKNIDQTSANRESIGSIMLRLRNLMTSLTSHFEGETRYAEKEVRRRETLKKKFDAATLALDHASQQNTVVAFLNNQEDSQNITDLIEDIKDAIIDYQTSLQQDIFEMNYDLNLLDKLPRVKEADFLSGNSTPCLKGTRMELLQEIETWSAVADVSARPIYWLNGIPGTGKTTVAHTFAQVMFAEGRLGGSFFCSRDYTDRSNIRLIFPTIAFQLAYQVPEFRAAVVETIRSQPDVGYQSLWDQLTKLIINPLQSISQANRDNSPIIIVVDALDECSDSKSVSAVLSLLSHHVASIPLVKIFITSRPEYHIRNIFRSPLQYFTRELVLQDVDRATVDRDIGKYLLSALSDIITERPNLKASLPWPDARNVEILVQRSGGLFIHASTSLKFIASRYHHPPTRLQLLLSIPHSSVYEGKLGIDPLYSGILVHVYKDADTEDAELFSELRLVMGCVVLAFNPMSRASLAILLGAESEIVLTILDSLHSVLRVPDGGESSQHITVFHKSFPDYLTDPIRCKDLRFYVDPSFYHGELAVRCFELMKTQLKRNICDLPRFAMNADVDDLAARGRERIADALDYACRYVGKHLRLASSAGDVVGRILKLAEDFMRYQLLPWLEVLSVVDDLRSAIHSIRDLRTWVLNVDGSDDTLLDLIEDSERFVLYSFDAIEQSASHIYESSLQWVPTTSPIGNLYRDQASTEVKVIGSDAILWDACVRTIAMMATVFSVSFSHTGHLIAGSGSDSSGGVVQIFEATTGARVATLNGHNGLVYSTDFSFDDALLVSGSDDNTVRVWDVQTGGIVSIFEGHTEEVVSVAFSPRGTMVVSGSEDNTIRIWDLSSGGCQWTLTGHTGGVLSVCWSQTRNEIISGSADGMVKLWDPTTGDCWKTFHEHTDYVESVASSPDGSKIASGSQDKTIRIYDLHTGGVLRTISANSAVFSISFTPDGDKIVFSTGRSVFIRNLVKETDVFTITCQSIVYSATLSPDGTSVASGSDDGFLRVWQLDSINHSEVASNYHIKTVHTVSFATDGQFTASASADHTIKVWDVTTGACLHTFLDHSGTVYSIAISPNSHLVASGSFDTTVRIWSTRAGDLINTLEGHENCVIAVQFSPNSDRIVSQSLNGTIILWDTDGGEKLAVFPGGISVEGLIAKVGVGYSFVKSFGKAFGKAFIRTTVKSSPQSLCDIGGDAVIEAFSETLDDAMVANFGETMVEVWAEGLIETLEETISRYIRKPVSFSDSGTSVILESKDGMIIWSGNIATNPERSSNDNALPMILIPTNNAGSPRPNSSPLRKYRYSPSGEWVLDQRGRRVFWIPADWRGYSYAFHGDKLFLGTRSGKVSLLDFSGMKL